MYIINHNHYCYLIVIVYSDKSFVLYFSLSPFIVVVYCLLSSPFKDLLDSLPYLLKHGQTELAILLLLLLRNINQVKIDQYFYLDLVIDQVRLSRYTHKRINCDSCRNLEEMQQQTVENRMIVAYSNLSEEAN